MKQPLNHANPLAMLLLAAAMAFASTDTDYSAALQTHFAKGTLGSPGKTRPIEMFFQNVFKSGNVYSVSGKSKTNAAEDAFSGTLTISSVTAGGSCASGETEIKGSYNLNEKESKTSGYFAGSFTACEKSGKLSKASFKGDWVKHATGSKTPCNFELGASSGQLVLTPEIGEFFRPRNDKDVIDDDTEYYIQDPNGIYFGDLGSSQWDGIGYKEEWTASSTLAPQGKIRYDAINLQNNIGFGGDRSVTWCEGVKGHGIGERVNMRLTTSGNGEYGFTAMAIVNGYAKNQTTFKNNSRVKILRLYIDGKHWADLHLKDVIKPQFFKFPNSFKPHNSGKKVGDGTFGAIYQTDLNFEIIEVYTGDKYDDTCISGIALYAYANVYCFGAGTKILMSDNSLKNIESIQKGNMVKSYDFKNKKLIDSKVTKLISASHSDLLKLKFASTEIVATTNHHFWIEKGVWEVAGKLKIGDKVFMPEKNVGMEIVGMETIDKQQTTYTIELSEGDNFIANGMLVKTETLGGSL